jgi:hypothetical protein
VPDYHELMSLLSIPRPNGSAAEVATGRLKVLSIPVPFPHFVAMQINRDALPLPAVRQALDIITGLLPRLRSTG